MYRGHTVGVVIPAYNEEPFVRETIETVPAFVDRIYAIDDASTDGTWAEITAAATAERDAPGRGHGDGVPEADRFDRRIVPIQHERNRGVGGAIKTGYLRARDDEIAATAVMGGDGQMRPDHLERLLDPILDGEADYVKGNRMVGSRGRGDMPRHRFVGNAVLGALTKIASGYWSTGDPQSGYTAISHRALREANVEEMYEFYGYCNDLLVKLNVAGLRVVDLPRAIVYGEEESHIRYRTYVPRVSWMLLRNFLWRLRVDYVVRSFHPLVVAYAVGAGATAAGLLGFLWSLPGVGSVASPPARALAAAPVFVLGVLSLVAAMVLDKHENAGLDAVLFPDRDAVAGGPRAPERADRRTDAPARPGVSDAVVESDGGRPGDSRRDGAAERRPDGR